MRSQSTGDFVQIQVVCITLVCTSTEMYYFVLFRKLHGLVGQTFHHLLGRQVKMKEEQLISAEHTVGYNRKKMQIGQELPS